MKPVPFDKVKTGDIFRDMDGNSVMRTAKTYSDNEGKTVVNCIMLISNKTELSRGELFGKSREIYCEVLNEREISELTLVVITKIEEVA